MKLENGISEIKHKEEIIEVKKENSTTIAIVMIEKVIRNFALTANEEKSISYYAIANQNNTKYIRSLKYDNIEELKKDLININNSFLQFELPLSTGKYWDCQGERTDNYYWTVISAAPNGSYVLEYLELSGHTRYTLKTEIGVTKYKYHHNRTFDDEILFLVDYKIN